MQLSKLPVVLGMMLFCASHFVWAQNPQAGPNTGENQQSGEHHHHTPSPEAYAACEGKAAGAAASFVGRRGDTINGVCQADESGKLFVRRERQQQ